MIAAANTIIRPAISFGSMPAPGAEMRAERQVAAQDENDDAEDDEEAAGDVVGAEGHARDWRRAFANGDDIQLAPPPARRFAAGGGAMPARELAVA